MHAHNPGFQRRVENKCFLFSIGIFIQLKHLLNPDSMAISEFGILGRTVKFSIPHKNASCRPYS
jgi:hypothetical protein